MFSKTKRVEADIAHALAVELDTEFRAQPAETLLRTTHSEIVQISEYYAGKLDELLTVNKRHEADLSAQLADITERLRQTRLVIASLEPAQDALAKDVRE